MPNFYLTPSLKGYISAIDLLSNEGTLVFYPDKEAILSGGFIFQLEGEDFVFALSIQNRSLVLRRNEVMSILNLDDIVNKDRIGLFAIWKYSSLQLTCRYGSGEEDVIQSEVPTNPVTPPNELIKWSRKNNLLPQEEYESEEDFRNKIHSCLSSIQTKIDQAGSYYQFWNVIYDGQKIKRREPKNEVEIQPVIHCFLSDQFLMSSIEIIPEFNSGVGNLDFLFIGKIRNKGFGYFCAEFKNAHSRKLEDGLLKQLPTYMENKTAKYGAYCVLNYYGEWLKKPKKLENKTLDFELDLIKTRSKNPYLDKTRVFVYNLSKPVSASKK